MANNWKETQQLFSKLISDPPLEQKFLQNQHQHTYLKLF